MDDLAFSIFQYFLTVVPTRYINASGRKVDTNQYSVTDYVRVIEHGKGVPGSFPLLLFPFNKPLCVVFFL